ncbi:EAL domain-containing protein [Rhodanobacter sp. AS-Z3]|uniref:bifunctional diguanylate cyclase/phosphodiesterase n=1 Tax=Rhodanobacter sp. AS-Z3 TaxID=3031330 RepID=UPI00247A8468|nr:EAL domain-containing protein [Rhodanobacter sp. AS-Z3]WEN15932.1 EAL domain-containing protein [Rhodanobacter sp. AS-Z3]
MAESSVPTVDASVQAAPALWLGRLIEANTPMEVGALIIDAAESVPGCAEVCLLWSADEVHPYGASPTAAEAIWARHTLDDQRMLIADDGCLVAWRLLSSESFVLLLRFTHAQHASPLREVLESTLALTTRRLRHAIDLADLYRSHALLARSENLQRALFAISDLAGSELEMPELLRGIHAIVGSLMYGENFFIVRYHPERGSIRFLYFVDAEDLDGPDTTLEEPLEDLRNTLTWHLLTGGKAMMGPLDQVRQQVSGPLVVNGPDCGDWLGVPMLRNGQVFGGLVVQSYSDGRVYSDEDRALLEFVAKHILTALERKQSKAELELRVRQRTQELARANEGLQLEIEERQRAEKLQASLFQLAQLATADIDEHEFYQRVHAVVGALINAENFFIGLVNKAAGMMTFTYVVDVTDEVYVDRPLVRGLSEYVVAHGPLIAGREAVRQMARRGLLDLELVGTLAECWLGVPLMVGEEVIGLVAVQNYAEEAAYVTADQELLSFAALQIANSIYRRSTAASLHEANTQLERRVEERTHELRQQIRQREEIQEQLKHQVMHDALTGLPNRSFLRDRLARTLALIKREPNRRFALLYLDIDRFKVINDSLGHLAGDQFLQEVARRLLSCVREPDLVARLSGDEFAILLEEVPHPGSAMTVAQRMLTALAQPLLVDGRELEPSASIGIAIGDATYAGADEVLRDADTALYRAKEKGRKRFELFDETLAKNAIDVLTLEGELRHALVHDEFEPYFQPIRRLSDNEVVGYEALIRWNHPQRGLIGPDGFIKIAQDCGMIEAIDWRMFELSCRALAQHGAGASYVTINVSALHLGSAGFDTRLLELVERCGLSPGRLIAEVTEGALIEHPERVRAMLERLRSVGVGAALDDFGTGYSSLSYLHSLPLRMLKIDRAFVQELNKGSNTSSTRVVAAILALARALDLQVVAEGIETEVERDALIAMGCERGQGYLLGRPAPVRKWLTPRQD